MRLFLLIVLKILFCSSIDIQSKLTIDDYFNATYYLSTNLSPDGQYLLVGTKRAAWNSNTFEDSLWLFHTFTRRKQLITKKLSQSITPQWSPSGNWFFYLTSNNQSTSEQHIYFYNVISKEELSIQIGNETISSVTWSDNDFTIYIAVRSSQLTEHSNDDEWKDVIQYRQDKPNNLTVIYRIDFMKKNQKISIKKHFIRNLNFLIGELLFNPSASKLIFNSISIISENISDNEIYSLDLRKKSILTKLTNNQGYERSLKLSNDGKYLFFQFLQFDSNNKDFVISQGRLYSIDLINGQIDRWGNNFIGAIRDYTIRSEGGVYLLGQLGTNIQIYSQQSLSKQLILQSNTNGTFRSISSSSSKRYSSIAYLYSSSEQAEEVYFVNHIRQLKQPRRITNENQFLTNKNLPRTKLYHWMNNEDNRMIEGILHYPPGKFQEKNLPLLVLIHGGPTDASLNFFYPDWYSWAPLAATEGWLVLEPNYRGSIGYGDAFVNEVRFQLLSRPGKDILFGVDQLVHDGIADPTRLNIGGYSYGGLLTNWLITQTTRFNAALSGAGVIEHSSMFGRTDVPVYIKSLIGGFPWELADLYVNESAIYQLDKVQTPTLITTGTDDVRVPTEQSFMLERSLYYLGVPVQLLLFPNEGHDLAKNPWHGKIKIREELKWLEKYGHR